MRFRAGPIKPTTISFLEVCTFEVGVGVLLTSSHFTFRPLSLVGGPDSPLVTIDRQRDRIKENGNMIFFKKKILVVKRSQDPPGQVCTYRGPVSVN